MASIINSIVTRFTTDGAEKTVSATEEITKSQTRLGNSSSSNGRQFAAQSQGLGGLVAAYAGAAATSFALQQAFSALQKSANFEQIIQGTNVFSSQFGQSATSLLGDIKKITQGQLSIADAAEQANLALSAGFNPAQLKAVTDIATKASRALGRDLTDSYQRIIKGAAKLEPELLDELGIFTRIDPAVEAYASKIGKAAVSLTDFERRQAFLNAVIDEGSQKFKLIDTSSATSAQSYNKLKATITDLALSMGSFIADAAAPLANYISGNLSATFGAFGIILTLILGKLNQVATAGLQNVTNSITTFSNSLSTSFLGTGEKAKQAIEELATATLGYNKSLGQGLGDQRARRNELIDLAKAGTISINQARELKTIAEEQVKRDNALSAATKAQQLTVAAGTAEYDNYDKTLKRLKISHDQNEAVINATTAAIERQSIASKVAAVSVGLFGKAVAVVGGILTAALKIFNVLTLLYSIASLLGPALLNAFGLQGVMDRFLNATGQILKNMFGLDDASKQLQTGINGVSSALVEAQFESQKVATNIEGIVKDKVWGFTVEVKINAETIQKDLAEAINKAKKAAEKGPEVAKIDTTRVIGASTVDRNINFIENRKRIVGVISAEEEEILAKLKQQKATIAPLISDEARRAGYAKDYQASLNESINELLRKKALASNQDLYTQKLLDVQIASYREALGISQGQYEVVGKINAITGISAKTAYQYLKVNEDGTSVLKTQNSELQGRYTLLTDIQKLQSDGDMKGAAQAEILNTLQAKADSYQINLNEGVKNLAKGNLDVNAIVKARSSLSSDEQQIQKDIAEIIERKLLPADDARLLAIKAQLGLTKEQNREYDLQSQNQQAILNFNDVLRKSFSSQISSLGQITGLIDGNGKIATTDLEVNRNKLSILSSIVESYDQMKNDIGEAVAYGVEMTGDQKALQTAAASAQSIMSGMLLESVKSAVSLTKEYEKQTIELNKQVELSKLTIQKDALQMEITLGDKRAENANYITQTQLNEIERQKALKQLAFDRINILRQGREEEAKAQMSGVLAPLFTDKNKRDIEIKFKEEELNTLKQSLASQQASAAATLAKETRLANDTYERDKARSIQQRELIDIEAKIQTASIQSKIEDFNRQKTITDQQAQATKDSIVALVAHPQELQKVFSSFLVDLAKVLAAGNPSQAGALNAIAGNIETSQTKINENNVRQLETITTNLNKADNARIEASKAYLDSLNNEKLSIEELAKKRKEIEQLGLDKAELINKEAISASTAKYNQVILDTGNKLLAAQQSLEILKREAERANNSFIVIAVKTAEAITSNFEKSMNSLVDAIASGTLTLQSFRQGFKQFIINILSDITKAILTETITKPFKEVIFGFTRDLIGSTGDVTKGLTDNASKAITSSLGENITKNTEVLKNAGITAVYVTNFAEFCACSSGNAVAGTTAASTAAAAGEASTGALKAATASTGGVIDLTTKVATESVTKAATKAASQTIETAPAGIYDNISNPVLAGANGYIPAIPDISGTSSTFGGLATRGIGQSTIPAFGSQQLSSPAELGATGITTSMAPAGLQSTFGIPGSFAGGNMYSTGDYNRLTGSYTRASYPDTKMGASDMSLDPAAVEKLNKEFGSMGKTIPEVTSSFNDLNVGQDAFKGTLDSAKIGVEGLSSSTNNLIPAQDAMSSVTMGNTTALQAQGAAIAGSAAAAEGEAVTRGINTASITTNTVAENLNTSATVSNAGAKVTEGGGGFFSSIISGITGFFGKASGGYMGNYGAIQRFAGGGVKMRDSVPSLLEPGEFVMKKSSVNSIGRNNLERMNATGRPNNSTNIKVQVENQGSPKQAEQGQTQFDGETAIVKLILKDLNSNGPIRRSIRGM